MSDTKTYFAALDRAAEALAEDAKQYGSEDENGFFWGLIMKTYSALVQPAVSCLPRQASLFVGEGLRCWAEHQFAGEEEICPFAQKLFKKWFDERFIKILREAAMESENLAKTELESYVNRYLASEGFPPMSLVSFSLKEFNDMFEQIIREQALPFMLNEIFSYEFIELDDGDEEEPDHIPQPRKEQLDEGREALWAERDFRVGFERNFLTFSLINDELLRDYGQLVYARLCEGLEDVKRRLSGRGS